VFLSCLLSAFCAPTSLHARCGFNIGPPVSALALAEFASHFETPSTPPRSLACGGLALVASRVGQLPGQLAHLLQPLSHLLAQPALLAPSQHSIQCRKRPSGPEFLNPAEHPVITDRRPCHFYPALPPPTSFHDRRPAQQYNFLDAQQRFLLATHPLPEHVSAVYRINKSGSLLCWLYAAR